MYSLFQSAGCMFQRTMIFYPEQLSADTQFETITGNHREIFITTSDNEKINGILFRADTTRGVILYFHGNAGSLKSWQYIWNDFNDLRYDLLIIDYRGYGKSSGTITEEGLYLDALASYDFLLKEGYKENDIILYGRSIGTGVAVDLAIKRNVRGMILESPYLSLKWLVKDLYPFSMPDWVLAFKFSNVDKAPMVKCPVLLLHGDSDEIIPVKHSAILNEVFTCKKELVIIQGGGHNDLNQFPEFKSALEQHLKSWK